MNINKKFLNTSDLAAYLGITYYMARKIMQSREFPAFAVNDPDKNLKVYWLVDIDDLKKWITQCKKTKKFKRI